MILDNISKGFYARSMIDAVRKSFLFDPSLNPFDFTWSLNMFISDAVSTCSVEVKKIFFNILLKKCVHYLVFAISRYFVSQLRRSDRWWFWFLESSSFLRARRRHSDIGTSHSFSIWLKINSMAKRMLAATYFCCPDDECLPDVP